MLLLLLFRNFCITNRPTVVYRCNFRFFSSAVTVRLMLSVVCVCVCLCKRSWSTVVKHLNRSNWFWRKVFHTGPLLYVTWFTDPSVHEKRSPEGGVLQWAGFF